MSRGVRQRLNAFVLLLLFAGSGVGLPAVDELLYHSGRDPGPLPGLAHLDPPHGCGAHSERCALNVIISVQPLGSVAQAATRIETTTSDYVAFRFITRLRSIDRSLLQPSRAPPLSAS